MTVVGAKVAGSLGNGQALGLCRVAGLKLLRDEESRNVNGALSSFLLRRERQMCTVANMKHLDSIFLDHEQNTVDSVE